VAFTSSGGGGIRAEINVTPLVDVVLVLLIIFMVVTPMLQRGKDVQLPRARVTEKQQKQSDPLVLSVTADRKVWVESNELTEATLGERIASELARSPHRRILLKGDTSLSVLQIRNVMDRVKRAGASGVELAVEQVKEH
jgi:biopolymer transport protein TolR